MAVVIEGFSRSNAFDVGTTEVGNYPLRVAASNGAEFATGVVAGGVAYAAATAANTQENLILVDLGTSSPDFSIQVATFGAHAGYAGLTLRYASPFTRIWIYTLDVDAPTTYHIRESIEGETPLEELLVDGNGDPIVPAPGDVIRGRFTNATTLVVSINGVDVGNGPFTVADRTATEHGSLQYSTAENGQSTARFDNFTLPSASPAPATPSPATPAPSTPAPTTPAPSTPAPSTPASATPSPATPAMGGGSGEYPAWRPTGAGPFYQLPFTLVDSPVCQAIGSGPTLRSGASGAGFVAYNGAALDWTTGRLHGGLEGGHADGFTNPKWSIPLLADNPTFARNIIPSLDSAVIAQSTTGYYVTTTPPEPTSRHVYRSVWAFPSVNKLVYLGTSSTWGDPPTHSTKLVSCNLDGTQWDPVGTYADAPLIPQDAPYAQDRSTEKVWVLWGSEGDMRMSSFHPSSGWTTTTGVPGNYRRTNGIPAVIDRHGRYICLAPPTDDTGLANGPFFRTLVDNHPWTDVTFTFGPGVLGIDGNPASMTNLPWKNGSLGGWTFLVQEHSTDETKDRVLVLNMRPGLIGTVYAVGIGVTGTTWNVTKEYVHAGGFTLQTCTGSYTKPQYVPQAAGVVMVPTVTQTQFLDTSDWDAPNGATSAPATPAPATPAPSTPAPSTPAPATPSPATPAPSTPAPGTPAPAAQTTLTLRLSSPENDQGGCKFIPMFDCVNLIDESDPVAHDLVATATPTDFVYQITSDATEHSITVRPTFLNYWGVGNNTKLRVHKVMVGATVVQDYGSSPLELTLETPESSQAKTWFIGNGTIGRSLTVANTIKVTNATSSPQTNVPVSEFKWFRKGEIANYPRFSLAGTPLDTQANVMSRWQDGSVMSCHMTAVLPTLAASATVTLAIINQATNAVGATPLMTPSQLVAATFASGTGDAGMTLVGTGSSAGFTREVKLSDLVAANKVETFIGGPLMTWYRFRDPAGSFDFDFVDGTKKHLHPIIDVKILAGGFVFVSVGLENNKLSSDANKSARPFDANVTFWKGSTKTVMTPWHFTTATQNAVHWERGKQYRCTDWLLAPPATAVDLNAAHDVATTLIDPYAIEGFVPFAHKPDAAAIAVQTAVCAGWNKKINDGTNDIGGWLHALTATGSAPTIGPMPKAYAFQFVTQDPTLRRYVLGAADLGGDFPIHWREADTSAGSGHWYDAAGTVDTAYRPVSLNARPTLATSDLGHSNDPGYVAAADDAHWSTPIPDYLNGYVSYGTPVDFSHCPEVASYPYFITGDPWFLDQMLSWGTYATTCTKGSVRRDGWGIYANSTQSRGPAWQTRTVYNAMLYCPDGRPEKAELQRVLKNNAAWLEGWFFNGAAPLTYSDRQAMVDNGKLNYSGGGGVSPLGFYAGGYDASASGNTNPQVADSASIFMQSFVIFAFSKASMHGFVDFKRLARHFGQSHTKLALEGEAAGQPYVISCYSVPIMKTDGTYVATVAEMCSLMPSGYVPQSWSYAAQNGVNQGFSPTVTALAALAQMEAMS